MSTQAEIAPRRRPCRARRPAEPSSILIVGCGLAIALLAPPTAAAPTSATETGPPANAPGKIHLVFPDNVPLKTVIDYVAVRLEKNILYDQATINRTLTIRSPVPIGRDDLLSLLRSVLRFRGLALVQAEQEGWLKIVPAGQLPHAMPLQFVRPGDDRDSNSVVVRVISLTHATAAQFAAMARPLLSTPGGNILELPDGQSLVVTDYKTIVDALLKLKGHLDVAHLRRRWKVLSLKNLSVGQITGDLKLLVGRTFLTASGKQDDSAPQALPVPRINAFLLLGTDRQIGQMAAFIELLDVSETLATEIYPLRNTGASRAAAVLRQLALPHQPVGGAAGKWIINVDEESNALIVTCPKAEHAKVAHWIGKRIDVAGEVVTTGLATRVFQVRYARASELVSAISSVFSLSGDSAPITLDLKPAATRGAESQVSPARQEPARKGGTRPAPARAKRRTDGDGATAPSLSLTVHDATNSIIATAPARMLGQIESLIKRLDHHRPQVLIDVTIVSVSHSDTLDIGVELNALRADTKAGVLKQGVLSSFGLLDIDPARGASTATFGAGFNAALLRPNEVAAIVRAFRSRLDGQVIARPQMLVDDNATGSLSSVTEHPFTSINSGETVSTTSFAGYAQAGTQMTLTPHISEGGVVHLAYQITSSSFTGTAGDRNLPPPRATDSVNSQVTIPSGYVLLVGGLTRENHQKSRREVPLLADIPLLGELFRVRSNSRSRNVLYIFLRPRILREDRFAYLKFISKDALKKAKVPPGRPALEMEFLQ